MKYNGKYSLKNQLLTEMDRMDFYQQARTQEVENKYEKIWKEIKNRPPRQVETFEDLKLMLKFTLYKKGVLQKAKKMERMGSVLGTLIKNIVGLIYDETIAGKVQKWGAVFKDCVNVFRQLMGSKASRSDVQKQLPKNNPSLDAFLLDDGYSKMLDGDVENELMKDWLKQLEDDKLTGPITGKVDSLTDFAEIWLLDNIGDGDQTVEGAPESPSLTDIRMPDMDQKCVKDILNALGTFAVDAF